MGLLFAVSQAQSWVREHVRPGDIVIDATAGNGSDTLFLARTVGSNGLVYAFDIQSEALEQTQSKLESALDQASLAPVYLIHAGHEEMSDRISLDHEGQIAAVMFNLGYLPGASSPIITEAETTLPALESALRLLSGGGLITVVVYPGHKGGEREAAAAEAWAAEIPSSIAQTVVYRFPQKKTAPYLIAIYKR
jgi:tRNA A58 N-methylase Trm61